MCSPDFQFSNVFPPCFIEHYKFCFEKLDSAESGSKILRVLACLPLASSWTQLPREASQYDVYCWAMDSAVNTQGLARPNYQTQACGMVVAVLSPYFWFILILYCFAFVGRWSILTCFVLWVVCWGSVKHTVRNMDFRLTIKKNGKIFTLRGETLKPPCERNLGSLLTKQFLEMGCARWAATNYAWNHGIRKSYPKDPFIRLRANSI